MNDTITPANLEALQGLLQCRLRGMVRDVRVVLRTGQVVVQGIAASYYAKQLAQHLALNTLATTALVNEIDVRRVTPRSESGAD
jgi:hypothetical protein